MKTITTTLCCTVLLLICGAHAPLHATGQMGDILVIGNDTLQILDEVIEHDSILAKRIRERNVDGDRSTGCWRGYIAIFRLENDTLYLEKIRNKGYPSYGYLFRADRTKTIKQHVKGKPPYGYLSLDSIFDEYKDKQGRIVASWYSRDMRVTPDHRTLWYEHLGFRRVYANETIYKMEKGRVVSQQTYLNTSRKASHDIQENIRMIRQNFSTATIPEFAHRRIVLSATVYPKLNGKIDSLAIRVVGIRNSEGTPYSGEIPPDHPLMKELRRCFELVPDWDVNIFYNEIRPIQRYFFWVED
jgi:hypothetical protein